MVIYEIDIFLNRSNGNDTLAFKDVSFADFINI